MNKSTYYYYYYYPRALQYASERLRASATRVLTAVASQRSSRVLKCVDCSLVTDRVTDKALALRAIAKDGLVLQLVSPQLQDDLEVVTAAIFQSRRAVLFVSDRLLQSSRLGQGSMLLPIC